MIVHNLKIQIPNAMIIVGKSGNGSFKGWSMEAKQPDVKIDNSTIQYGEGFLAKIRMSAKALMFIWFEVH